MYSVQRVEYINKYIQRLWTCLWWRCGPAVVPRSQSSHPGRAVCLGAIPQSQGELWNTQSSPHQPVVFSTAFLIQLWIWKLLTHSVQPKNKAKSLFKRSTEITLSERTKTYTHVHTFTFNVHFFYRNVESLCKRWQNYYPDKAIKSLM